MTKDLAKLGFAVLGYYSKAYESRYGVVPTINKYKEKWAAVSFVEDYGLDTVYLVIDYYFRLPKDHSISGLFNNFDSLLNAHKSNEQDEKLRAERRAETARIRQEFLNGNA